MSGQHPRDIKTDYIGGNYGDLQAILDSADITESAFLDARSVTFSSESFKALGSDAGGGNVGGNVAVGTSTTTTNGGIYAKAGTLGSALLTVDNDTGNNPLNAVTVRNGTTHAKITEGAFEVFGLLHTDATDGDAVPVVASTNLQLTLVYINGAGTITTASAYTGAVEFTLPIVRAVKHRPTGLQKSGGFREQLGQPAVSGFTEQFLHIKITTATAQTDTFNLTTKAITGTGVATWTGDAIAVPSQSALETDGGFFIATNGKDYDRNTIASGGDVEYVSANTVKFYRALSIGEVITVRKLA